MVRALRSGILCVISFLTVIAGAIFLSEDVRAQFAANYTSAPLDSLYASLDKMVENRAKYVNEREAQIRKLKSAYRNATNRRERYVYLSQLYSEYSYFNPDSALKYADLAYDASEKDRNALNTWNINKADIYSAAGLFAQAKAQLDDIDRNTIAPSLLPNYFNSLQYLYSHNAHYANADKALSEKLSRQAQAYNDSIGEYLTPDHPYSIWYEVIKADGKPVSAAAYNKLKNYVDKSDLNSRNDAIAAYWLSRAAQAKNDQVTRQRYLIMSAMADIRIANCDIASLEELANEMYTSGGIDRAYSYANYCAEMARMYHNRIRIVSLAELQDKLHKAYVDTINNQVSTIESQKKRLTLFLILACSLLVVSLISICFIIVLLRRNRRRREELNSANLELRRKIEELDKARLALDKARKEEQKLNASLALANDNLKEANNIKEQYIMYAFSMASDFINDVDSLLKKMLRKVKTNQYGELRNELDNPKFLTGEMKKFYSTFDRMFLSIYPDFINEINASLPDDEKVELKDGELPNTKMRIYALRKLGITESSKIAKMLRCSIQTVYNNRPKNT